MRRFSAAVLTVSDTAAKDNSRDASGPLVKRLLDDATYEVTDSAIVPDEVDGIRDWVASRAASGINLVICTGGTGFSRRDCTPEAVAPLIVRPAPGLIHQMMATSLRVTPLAALARPVAGLSREGALIVTLPGSPKGAQENLQALLPVLSHALDLATGGTGQATHEKLMAEGSPSIDRPRGHHHHGDHHHHGHEHHAPKARTILSNEVGHGPSSRLRKSPYPIINMSDAFQLIFDHTPLLPVEMCSVNLSLRGHILAEDVHAETDWPQTCTTNVDGYALLAATKPGVYPVTTLAKMQGQTLADNTLCRVNTGGPLPTGADAVIMVEDTLLADKDDSGEELRIQTLAQVDPGENVRQPGSDVRKGECVLQAGTVISDVGGEMGTLAFVGRTQVRVRRRPVVSLLSTGNELRDLHDGQSSASTIDSNRPSLHLALTALGYTVVDLGVAADTVPATSAALLKGVEQSDLIIATGGTSMGEADLLKPVIERQLRGTTHFGRVAMKPGKPTTFATLPGKARAVPVFALPGNPASALVTFNVFVLPALRKMEGRTPDAACHLPRLKAITRDALALDPRPEFHRVRLVTDANGRLTVDSTGGQRSSRTVSLASANALVALPSGTGLVQAGSLVDVVLIGSL